MSSSFVCLVSLHACASGWSACIILTPVMDSSCFFVPGQDPHDATSSAAPVTDFAAALPSVDSLNSQPLKGKRIGVLAEMMQGGIAPGVISAVQNSIKHLESLGADVSEVSPQ